MADDENAPATKKDLTQVEARILSEIRGAVLPEFRDTILSGVQSEIAGLREAVTEQIRDSQTEILKAFLPWQESVQTQFRKLEADMGNNVTSIQQRMNILERRLWEIEKRLLMNPPAA